MKTIETWFLWLMIYSIIGWVYESTICSIGHRKLINRGFLNGPVCPIYGTGAVLVLLVLGRIQNPVLLFFAGALVTCSLEYLTSWLMEKLFHARWWDYSKRKFNIGGRVCLIGAVVFGAFSVVLVLVLVKIDLIWAVCQEPDRPADGRGIKLDLCDFVCGHCLRPCRDGEGASRHTCGLCRVRGAAAAEAQGAG